MSYKTNSLHHLLFQKHTVSVAKHLLGYALVSINKDTIVGGKIVECEAYTAKDPCSHSYNGKTKRNAAMFLQAGHLYVYRIYGIHLCINIVTAKQDCGEAVLIRALEPLWGLENMQTRRDCHDITALCSGPGKLAQSLAINTQHNTCFCPVFTTIQEAQQEHRISKTPHAMLCLITFDPSALPKPSLIQKTTRIGVRETTPLLYRFYYKNNAFVSRKSK